MYEKHFRLRELPFNVTPDPRFFYTHPSCQEAFATLWYGVENRKGIVVITGAAGTGKTTLLKLFVEKAAPRLCAACIVDPHLTFIELLQCALDAFGVTPFCGDRFILIQQLRDYLLDQYEDQHPVALLLDESQEIDDEVLEELRLISDLEHAGEKLLQLVLAGQPEFESRLDHPRFHQLRQRVTLRSRLAPIAQDEIGAYIHFRLRAAGYTGKSIFENAAFQRIGYFSQGIPRVINVICDHALLIACVTNIDNINAQNIDEIADDLHLERSGSGNWQTPVRPGADQHPAIRAEKAEFERADELQGELVPPRPLGLSNSSGVSNEFALLSDLNRFRREWWRELSAAASVVLLILGGMYLGGLGETLFQSNKRIDHGQEGVMYSPRELYRVLGPGTLWETSVKQGSRAYPEIERFDGKKLAGDRDGLANGGQTAARSARVDRSPVTETKRPGVERRIAESPRPAVSAAGFAVVENSYVREKPASKAEVIATLRPGTRIQVVGRTGDYLRVRSLDNEAIRGYVHKEDAFFEPFP